MRKVSLQSVTDIHELLFTANNRWPKNYFTNIERNFLPLLEKRLARAVGGREIEFCLASVDDERTGGPVTYSATLFTSDLVIIGTMSAGDESATYPHKGDVLMVPRSAIRSLTINHVEYYDDDQSRDYVQFTAVFDGAPPVHVGQRLTSENDGRTSDLFDSLQSDLARVPIRA